MNLLPSADRKISIVSYLMWFGVGLYGLSLFLNYFNAGLGWIDALIAVFFLSCLYLAVGLKRLPNYFTYTFAVVFLAGRLVIFCIAVLISMPITFSEFFLDILPEASILVFLPLFLLRQDDVRDMYI